LTGNGAVFFSRKWGRVAARRIGPVLAIETGKGIVLDEFALIAGDGARIRFDLLAGQLKAAREEASHYRGARRT
jgi:hypothetical protein